MWNAEENKFGKIVDEESQTEYFFKNISTYVCNENGYLIDPSAPNTYLKIYPLENTIQEMTNFQRSHEQTPE